MTTRPLTTRLTTATLAMLVGIGVPALTAVMMARTPVTGAVPTVTLERVEVVARRIERPAETMRSTRTLPAGESARAEAPTATFRAIAM